MTNGLTPPALLDATIGVAAHLESELEEALAEHRLSRASYQVLAALEAAPAHALSQRALVATVRRTSGTMSVRLGRLEHAGMITRERDPEDGRNVTVTLTEAGLELVQAAAPTYGERSERLLEGLAPDARAALDAHVPAWLAFFEPDERVTPRLGVAVAPSAVAARMRRAVGLSQEPGVLVCGSCRAAPPNGRPLARRSHRHDRRRSDPQHRRARPRRTDREDRRRPERAARRRAAHAHGALRMSATVSLEAADRSAAALDAYSRTVVDVAEALTVSVVNLQIPRRTRRGTATGGGSAVVITPDGYLLTSAHVVDGAESGSASFPDGRETRVSVTGVDRLSDLAVLRADADALQAAPLGMPTSSASASSSSRSATRTASPARSPRAS